MRYSTRALLGVMLAVALSAHGSAEETKAPWWHFGGGKGAPSAPATVAPAPTMRPASPAMTPSPPVASEEKESWFSWPKWFESSTAAKPQSNDPFMTGSAVATATPSRQPRTHYGKPAHRPKPRNAWAQQPASAKTQAPSSSPWKSLADGTRSAWHKTVDYVSPSATTPAASVAREPHESWWHRMWGSDEKQQGPQTVTEWMAQDRLDP
jgi:hypothetical protein